MNYTYHETSKLFEMKNVKLSLGGKQILDGVDLCIRDIIQEGHTRGQVRAILGPSGSGKSCALRIMTGLWKADEGEVTMAPHHGDDMSEVMLPVHPGMIGVVAQNYPLLAHLSLFDNLVLAARKSGKSRHDSADASRQLLERFNLIDHKDKWVHQLSGGQRQRSAILQQVLVGRRFLAMDEPFSGLDPVSLAKVLSLIEELTTENEFNTVIIITHDITAAARIADYLHILGRKFDGDQMVRAAHFVKTIDLMAEQIAWRPNKRELPQFMDVVHEVEALFATKI